MFFHYTIHIFSPAGKRQETQRKKVKEMYATAKKEGKKTKLNRGKMVPHRCPTYKIFASSKTFKIRFLPTTQCDIFIALVRL